MILSRGLTIILNRLPLWLLSIIVVALFSFQGANCFLIRADWRLYGLFFSPAAYCGTQGVEKKFIRMSMWSNLVEMRRIELLTPCLQGRCSPSWATPPYTWVFNLSLRNTALKLPRCTHVLSSSLCLVLRRLPSTKSCLWSNSILLTSLLPEECNFS